jgi:hypothetical protein
MIDCCVAFLVLGTAYASVSPLCFCVTFSCSMFAVGLWCWAVDSANGGVCSVVFPGGQFFCTCPQGTDSTHTTPFCFCLFICCVVLCCVVASKGLSGATCKQSASGSSGDNTPPYTIQLIAYSPPALDSYATSISLISYLSSYISLPFNFTFFGNSYSGVYLCATGFL